MSSLIPDERLRVACVGSSSTAGKGQAFDWIAELRRRPENRSFVFSNFGMGGDLAFSVLERLPDVIAVRPHKIVVWVGGNDVLVQAAPKVRRILSTWKHLPMNPSLGWYRENMIAIVRRLKTETSARIGLCSLAPIGEDLRARDGLQATLNRLAADYSAVVREIAGSMGCAYIPLWERMTALMANEPAVAFTRFRFLPFYRDAFRVIFLGKTPDEVAALNGWRFHSDGVHLNSRGGLLAADLVQEFLNRQNPEVA